MTSRLDMLRAARRSLSRLGETSSLVTRYLRSQLAPDGGFSDRAGGSDLYYTVFGLEALLAMGETVPPRIVPYLLGFGDGAALDLVHVCCLIRARASAGLTFSEDETQVLTSRLEGYRAPDGGYEPEPGSSGGGAYGGFLVAMAYEDLQRPLPSRDGVVHSLRRLRAADGGFANAADQDRGLTPTTAAVAELLRSLGAELPDGLDAWLLQRHLPGGGFCAVPNVPFADLLSTATALQALSSMGVSLDGIREPCVGFVESLWTGDGAFAGSWVDPTPDCEYTYYGLLALGHLVP